MYVLFLYQYLGNMYLYYISLTLSHCLSVCSARLFDGWWFSAGMCQASTD